MQERRVWGSAFGKRVQLREGMGRDEGTSGSELRAKDGAQPHCHTQTAPKPVDVA